MEDFAATSQAFDEIVDAELALDRDGKLLALRADVVGDVGAYSIYPWTAALEPVQVVSFLPGPYRVEHYRGRVEAVATCKPPTGPYRGVGRPVSTFVMERLIDMAAARLALDPKEIRLRNLVQPDEFPHKIGSGIVWDKSGFVEGLERRVRDDRLRGAAPQAGRGARERQMVRHRHRVLRRADRHRLAHLGRARHADQHRHRDRDHPHRLDRRDHGGVRHRVARAGAGDDLAQVIAEHLGARMEDVRVIQGDSAAVPGGTGTYASRSMVLAGGAARLASETLREKVVNVASHLLEAAARRSGRPPTGASRSSGTDRSVSFRDVARAVYSEMARLPQEAREELAATKTYDPVFGTTTSATHIAALEIDPETYQVRMERFVVAEDCGRVVNPLIVDGQVHGGVAQGIGAALYEEIVYDAQGQLHTASLVDYLVPSACEIPPMDVAHIETLSPNTLGGFRGMGEGGTIGAPAAVANAVADALCAARHRDQRASRHPRAPVPPDRGGARNEERVSDGSGTERQGRAGHRRGARRRARDRADPGARRRERRDQLSLVGQGCRCARRPRSRRPAARRRPTRPMSRTSPPSPRWSATS